MSPKYSLRLDVRLLEDLSLTSQELTELLQVRAEKLIRRLDIRHSNAHPYQLFEYFSWYACIFAPHMTSSLL
ncbi:MAG: hypothetical protein RMK35_02290 [Aquificaceae bacterium]|nr:hypothetical protein [Aquificaceae bacterium]